MSDPACLCSRCGSAGLHALCSIKVADSYTRFKLCVRCLEAFVRFLEEGSVELTSRPTVVGVHAAAAGPLTGRSRPGGGRPGRIN
jgi:hypothetical protein